MEVLDVTEEEARKLLLTIDPLAALAEQQEQLRRRLLDITPAANTDLQLAWTAEANALLQTPHKDPPRAAAPELYLIHVTSRDEKEQIELLLRFKESGLTCKALLA